MLDGTHGGSCVYSVDKSDPFQDCELLENWVWFCAATYMRLLGTKIHLIVDALFS